MRLLLTLLRKDLVRGRRNPWVILINLALPVLITALIAMAFGGSSSGGGMGTIKLAIVDEDESFLSEFLRGGFQQGEAAEFIQPMAMSREEAMRAINDDEISAVMVLPKGFASDFLHGRSGLKIELIKNPAQRYHPAIVEEMLGVLVEGLNALSINLGGDLAEWLEVFSEDDLPDFLKMSQIYVDLDRRAKALRDYLAPPLVTFESETRTAEGDDGAGKKAEPMAEVFAFVLPGMASMFLLFIADASMRDIFREIKHRTFDRFRTMHHRLFVFISSKVISTLIITCVGGFILFFGSTLIFRFSWSHPFIIAALVGAYGLAAAGLLAFCAAISRNEKRADAINITLVIGMSFIGGAYFPAENLPTFVGENISPYLPNYWLIETIRGIHFGHSEDWIVPMLKLTLLGIAFMAAAAMMFRSQLSKGGRE